MGSILLFILFLFIIVVVFASSILRGIIHFLFGRRTPHNSYDGSTQASPQSQQNAPQSGSAKKEKVFDKTDGEYVDFEEVEE